VGGGEGEGVSQSAGPADLEIDKFMLGRSFECGFIYVMKK
jgi:hypothetical protein